MLLALLSFVAAAPATAATGLPIGKQLEAIEADLLGFPERAEAALVALQEPIGTADAGARRFAAAMLGQARAAAGRQDEARALAEQLERVGRDAQDDASTAVALLIQIDALGSGTDLPRTYTLARNAQALARNTNDEYLRFRAALELGVAARMLGRSDEALASLQEAYGFAESAGNSYRRGYAAYQLAVLHRALNQADAALADSKRAFSEGKLAQSTYVMAKARIAESAALELLNQPAAELAAVQDALAIARAANSAAEEGLVLVNLSDTYLRRKDFRQALELSQKSLEIASHLHDPGLVAANKANMGFALIGLRQIDAGKRLADEALAQYEGTGAYADIADLTGEYTQSLVDAGDYKGALALRDRQQKVIDTMVKAIRDKDLLDMQTKLDSERRVAEIELHGRETRQRIWWLLAVVSAISFLIVALLYRKVGIANRLLARQNTELGFYSTRDPLTSLYNRRHFQNFVDKAMGDSDRRTGTIEQPVPAILLIDLDHFKSINDRFGHAAGDAVLIAVAQRLRDALRETDMIVRWGGEEFLVYVPMAPVDHIDEIVMRVLTTISATPIRFIGNAIHVTASIGYAPMVLPPNHAPLGWESALDLVDKALYLAKSRGRNRAFGVVGMQQAGDDALAANIGNLDEAWHSGNVEGTELLGAPPEVAVPAH